MRIFVLALLALVLTACGGGGSSDSGSSSSSSFTVTAIDGYLSSAEVYVDRNGDGVAGSDELIGSTDINGQIVLDNVNKAYPIIIRAVAGITRDSDYSGAIAENYEMVSSAGKTVVTPFTTLSYLYDIPMDEVVKKLDPDGSLGLDVDMLSGDYAAINTNAGVVSQALARSMAKALKDEISNNKDSGSQTTNTLDSYVNSIVTTLDTQVAAAANIADDLNETVITIVTNSEGAVIPTTTSTTALDAASSGSGSSGSGSSGSGSSGSGSSGSGSSGSGSSGSGSSGSGSSGSGSSGSGSSGSGSSGSGSSGSGSTPTTAPLAISNLRLSVSGENTFTFRWTDVDEATYYNLWENIDGKSSYTRVGSGITPSRIGYDDPYNYTALVSARLNALFIVQSCNDIGCTSSTPLSVSDFYVPVEPFKLTFSQTKSFDFTWPAKDGATHYKLMENADGNSGFVQVGENIASDTFTYSHIVPLYARMNAQYILQSCNNDGCTDSETLSVSDTLVDSIGFVKASNTGKFDRFGYKVVLSSDGNTMAISAYHESSGATGVNGDQSDDSVFDAGAVYVFIRDNNLAWSQQAYLKASNTEKIDRFGNALSLSADGSTLAVGAQDEDSNAVGINGDQANNSLHQSGAVYIFTRDNNSTWSQQAYVKASNPGLYDAFGVNLTLSSDGNTLAVGANGENSNAKGINGDQSNSTEFSSGAVYVFTRSDTSWSQQAYVKASNSYRHTHFGKSLALSSNGSTLAVGAPNEHSNSTGINGDQNNYDARNSGAVYMFTRDTSNLWTQHSYIKASNTQEGDLFAGSLALSADGKTLAVGAISEDSNATGINGNQNNNDDYFSGAVYVFTQSISNIWSQQAYIKASNTDKHDQFGYSIALSSDGDTLAVSATSESSKSVGMNGNQSDNSGSSGAIYLFTRNNLSWNQQAYIKPPIATVNDYTGRSIALSAKGETLAVGSTSEKSNVTGIGGTQVGYDFAYESGAVFLY